MINRNYFIPGQLQSSVNGIYINTECQYYRKGKLQSEVDLHPCPGMPCAIKVMLLIFFILSFIISKM